MTNIDDIDGQVRSLLAKAAENIVPASVPPLRLPPGQRLGRSPAPARTWLMAAAAAAAVALIVAAVAVAASLPRTHRPSAQPGQPVAVVGVPAYYIAQPTQESPEVMIYATATGQAIAPVLRPAVNQRVSGVSAAADDRTFVVALWRASPGSVLFYLAKFDPVTRTVDVSLLPKPRLEIPEQLTTFALSPDGTRLAVAYGSNVLLPSPEHALTVVNLKTGSSRTWTSSRGSFAPEPADSSSLSWAGDDRTLTFTWFAGWELGRRPGLNFGSGVRLLDLGRPGRDLVDSSRQVVPFVGGDPSIRTSAGSPAGPVLMTPNGQLIVMAAISPSGLEAGFAQFSVATGALELIVKPGPFQAHRLGGPAVMWSSPDGSILVVYGPPGHPGRLGVLHGARLTFIPRPIHINFPNATW